MNSSPLVSVIVPTPKSLSNAILHTLQDQKSYETLRHNALTWSKNITFEKQYEDFKKLF